MLIVPGYKYIKQPFDNTTPGKRAAEGCYNALKKRGVEHLKIEEQGDRIFVTGYAPDNKGLHQLLTNSS